MPAFNNYYETLTDKEKADLRKKVLERTGMSLPSFYYKKRHGNFTKLEKEKIGRMVNVPVTRLFREPEN